MLEEKILKCTAQIDNEIDDFITVTVNRELAERNTRVNAKKIAEAVEKQIPKKPKYNGGECECPTCGDDWNSNEYGSGMKFCWECGQKLDWSDEND